MAPFSFGVKPLQEGDSASVQCSVTNGDLPITIFWFYNSQPIENLRYVSISRLGKRVSALTIDSVSHRFIGNYTCLGRNAAGEAKETAVLLVNGSSQKLKCMDGYHVLVDFSFSVTQTVPTPQSISY